MKIFKSTLFERWEGTAEFSACGIYRYTLTRKWDEAKPMICFIGLNPSTADAEVNDPTIRRCIGFAHDWGFGGLLMLNLFAFRATDPKRVLKLTREAAMGEKCADGNLNDAFSLRSCAKLANAKKVVACWGANALEYGKLVSIQLAERRVRLCRFDRKGSDYPGHPLYLPATSKLVAHNYTPGHCPKCKAMLLNQDHCLQCGTLLGAEA
jgi:hypothetical protein